MMLGIFCIRIYSFCCYFCAVTFRIEQSTILVFQHFYYVFFSISLYLLLFIWSYNLLVLPLLTTTVRSLDNRQFDTQNFQFINISISTSIRPLAMCTFANCRQIPDTRYKYLDTNQSKIVSVSLHLDNASCSCCSLLFNHSYWLITGTFFAAICNWLWDIHVHFEIHSQYLHRYLYLLPSQGMEMEWVAIANLPNQQQICTAKQLWMNWSTMLNQNIPCKHT